MAMAVIGLRELKRLATTRSFARGEAYLKDGRVDYLAELRVEYKRKRNFIKLLDTIESL